MLVKIRSFRQLQITAVLFTTVSSHNVIELQRRGWLGGAKVSCIFCHPGRPADIG